MFLKEGKTNNNNQDTYFKFLTRAKSQRIQPTLLQGILNKNLHPPKPSSNAKVSKYLEVDEY